jgi:hypothetical protein
MTLFSLGLALGLFSLFALVVNMLIDLSRGPNLKGPGVFAALCLTGEAAGIILIVYSLFRHLSLVSQ